MIWSAIEISLVLGVIAATILSSLVVVPAFHFGVVERMGRRTGRIMPEGLKVKIPFFERVELISLELAEISLGEKGIDFTTAPPDRLQLTIKGSLQYRPDPGVSENRRNVFITMSEAIIQRGISDAIKDLLGMVGGITPADMFIRRREAVNILINCLLRLANPPHRQTGVEVDRWIDFYADVNNRQQAIEALEHEREHIEDRSEIERRYGIDIMVFALAEIDFSDEVKKSFEKQRQAKARKDAFRHKITMARQAKKLGATAQEALNAADVSLDPDVKKQVVSVEGEAGVLGGLIARLGGKPT